ncbi:hypothetical protein E1B28_003515 [Marasmius oreades]|uniref:Uncharacterized protein n=1 Tax=Marasmius oreades TaxID=181124 RepID=A0A9P7RM46_9AGAR|nr:uncharacterized protein E1B28_003515 [Marasmius oreades]KAG7085992.1 hypothetical protein E1B28_003515 [Marasmius oreades]
MAANARLARTCSRRVLLSRLTIFQLFLEYGIAAGRSIEYLRRLWLLFQMASDMQHEHDVSNLSDVFHNLCEVYHDLKIGDDALSDGIKNQTRRNFHHPGQINTNSCRIG